MLAKSYNLCCLIDSLGSGGAQRQMTRLIRVLVERGHRVRLVTYYRQYDHFLHDLESLGVEPEYVDTRSKLLRFWSVRSVIRRSQTDCIISFLDTPNLMAILSSLGLTQIPVVVSERSLNVEGKTWTNWRRFQAFRLATRIVTNSHSQAEFVLKNYPFLKEKIRTILNSVDLNDFQPREPRTKLFPIRIIVGASVNPAKNTLRFLESLSLAVQRLSPGTLHIDWFGNNFFENGEPTAASGYYLEAVALVKKLGLERSFQFHPVVDDLHLRFRHYDAACLPSVFEGCPNFVCEAMASGLPILASNVSDLPMIVGSDCGRLFDPKSATDIAMSLTEFALGGSAKSEQQGRAARDRAEKLFAPQIFAERFEKVVLEAIGRAKIGITKTQGQTS
jgi:glycosyltransferase involved in cell wall biosynthesis